MGLLLVIYGISFAWRKQLETHRQTLDDTQHKTEILKYLHAAVWIKRTDTSLEFPVVVSRKVSKLLGWKHNLVCSYLFAWSLMFSVGFFLYLIFNILRCDKKQKIYGTWPAFLSNNATIN